MTEVPADFVGEDVLLGGTPYQLFSRNSHPVSEGDREMLYEGTDHWQITVNHTHILAGSNHSLQARLYLSRTHHKLQYVLSNTLTTTTWMEKRPFVAFFYILSMNENR